MQQVDEWPVRFGGAVLLDQRGPVDAGGVPARGVAEPVVADDAEDALVVVDDVGAGRLGLAEPDQHVRRPLVEGDGDAGSPDHVGGGEDAAAVDVGDEVGDVVVGRGLQDLRPGADLDQPAVLEQQDAVTQQHGLVEVVGDEHDRLLEVLLQADEQLLHVAPDQWVQRGVGLVHQEHLGVAGQRPGQPDPLLHAARELAGQRVGAVAEADLLQRPLRLLPAGAGVDAADLQPVLGVLRDGAVRQQREVLEHHRDPLVAQGPQVGGAEGAEIAAVDGDAARGRLDEPVQQPDQGRLARPGQTHDHEQLAVGDVEGHVVHGERRAGAALDLRPAETLAGQPDGLVGGAAVTEDLGQVPYLDHAPAPTHWRTRSGCAAT